MGFEVIALTIDHLKKLKLWNKKKRILNYGK